MDFAEFGAVLPADLRHRDAWRDWRRSLLSQIVGSALGAGFGLLAGYVVYLAVDKIFGFRMSEEEERIGADLAIHKISATPEDELRVRG